MRRYIIDKITDGYAEVTAHGLNYNYDDRTGKLSIWNISLFMDGGEESVERNGSIYASPKLQSKASSFVQLKQVLKVEPSFYSYDFMSNISFKITKTICKPGSSSLVTVSKMFDKESGQLLVERVVKFLRIDNNTRRPLQNPAWLLEKYANMEASPSEVLKNTLPELPKEVIKYRTVIRYGDMDTNFHTNQSFYIKSCFDCASAASLNKILVHFSGDICWYPVVFLSVDFLGESFPGDEIMIAMWQDKDDISRFRFYICNAQSRKLLTYVVCQLELNRIGHDKIISNL